MWDDLKDRVRAQPVYADLVQKLGDRRADVSVCGLFGGARSLLLSALAAEFDSPLLVIAPDPVKARDIEEDLRLFDSEGVVSYPEDEILPYDYHDPDRNLTGQQMKALHELTLGRCRALVCTVRSSLKEVFAPALFKELLIGIRKGEERDPIDLMELLVGRGYERQGIVEAKGQFALRGGILDIFEVCEEIPVRMEFDGDRIFSMRNFDIETQRSTMERDELLVRPLHHLAPTKEGIGRLAAWLDRQAAGLGSDERERIKLPAERLERGISFFGMEHYAAAMHEVVPILDYFDTPPIVVSFGAEDIEIVSRDFREEIARRYVRSREEGNIYPPPDDVYIAEEEFSSRLAALRRLSFRNLSWEGDVRFGTSVIGDYRRNLKGLQRDAKKAIESGLGVFLFCSNEFQRGRAEELLSDIALDIDFPIGELSSGFRWSELGILALSEEEVFGRYHRPYHAQRSQSRSLTYDPSHFKPGDFVVHLNHGIGRYMGLRSLDIEEGHTECLDIRYGGNDHLFIPVSQLRMVEKYATEADSEPALSRLGTAAWSKTRERARRSAERVAGDLLEIYAARQVAPGFSFGTDTPWQKEMEASFPFEETDHQLQSTAEVKGDMERPKPMDRLLCGDVGFGKTEVALRAAFKAVLAGKQCAVLVPTTVLAMQHYNTFLERLQGYPVNVAMLSRFISTAKQKKIAQEIAAGTVDIIIGTHRLLSKDVSFKHLGLVIIDEEHRFGVRHKETFKKMKKSVDVLSMTATPIPRTLHMALSGIRDISIIDTPPRNRLPIHTEILPFDDERIRDAVLREVDRGGQVFFVHNRVQSIQVMEGYLERLLPERVKIAHAHGQMRDRELEKIMIDFLERKFDVLVCTMIIEAGLDFSNVNTIVINRADKFGLAQLYQLRGRVGRSDRKAFAYLLVPKGRILTPTAVKRLQAISEFDYLGAGYRIAMRDLKIRGAGNLLGHEQSGHVSAVGLDLYTRMLGQEVSALRGEPVVEPAETRVSMPGSAYLPDAYITDTEERMDIYRRLTRVDRVEQVDEMRDELRDRFGPVPGAAANMLDLVALRVRARTTGVESIEADREGGLRVVFGGGSVPGHALIGEMAGEFEGRITFHTEAGFSLSLTPQPGGGPEASSGAAGDMERLLNLLEFYGK